MAAPVNFTRDAAGRIVKATRRVEQMPTGPQPRRPRVLDLSRDMLQGFLRDDMTAPANPLGPSTTVTLDVFARDPSDDTLSFTGVHVELHNYSVDLTADAGTRIIAAEVDGVWQPLWVDCEAAASVLTIDDEPLTIDGDPIIIT